MREQKKKHVRVARTYRLHDKTESVKKGNEKKIIIQPMGMAERATDKEKRTAIKLSK